MDDSPDTSPSQPAIPWEWRGLGPRPDISEFGYVDEGGAHPCGRLELIERCLGANPPPVVWTPDSPDMQLPSEVGFIRAAVAAAPPPQPGIGAASKLMGMVGLATVGVAAAGMIEPLWGFAGGVLALGAVAMGYAHRIGMRRAREAVLVRPSPGELKHAAYGTWLQKQPLSFTPYVAAGLGILAVSQYFAGVDPSVAEVGLVKPAVAQGEYWRLLTAALIHGGIIHFWFNFGALVAFGRQVEVHAGRAYVSIVFLISAIGASLASLSLTRATSVGASGGIMGLLGFLLLLHRRRPSWFPPGSIRGIWLTIGLNGLIGALGFFIIDNAAHLGGFLSGAALGGVLPLRPGEEVHGEAPSPALRGTGVGALAVLAVAALFALVRVLLLAGGGPV
jgi:membrane associated rhomboid family serine protease